MHPRHVDHFGFAQLAWPVYLFLPMNLDWWHGPVISMRLMVFFCAWSYSLESHLGRRIDTLAEI